MTPEEELMRRVQDGDEEALRSLYDSLSGPVFSLAHRMTGSREDAEEVLQDTFASVHDAADRFDPARASVRTWVYAIARNACRSRLRRRHARPKDAEGLDPHAAGVPLAAPATGANATDRLTVQQAFEALSVEEARLLEAAFFGGFSHAELAERAGVPLGTVKSRIRRALVKARAALRDGSGASQEEPS
jgi:RNA polymerase sigma-70 factor (ECF subfamily)